MINLWRVLGLVGIKVKFKYHQPSGFNQSKICILVVSSFHLGGGVCFLQKQLRNMCQAFISVFQETGSLVVLLCGGIIV